MKLADLTKARELLVQLEDEIDALTIKADETTRADLQRILALLAAGYAELRHIARRFD